MVTSRLATGNRVAGSKESGVVPSRARAVAIDVGKGATVGASKDGISLRLHGVVNAEGRRFLVSVTSLSEEGFTCTGAGLDAVADAPLRLTLPLTGLTWSPRVTAPMGTPPTTDVFEAEAKALDCEPTETGACRKLEARFVSVRDEDRTRLARFLAAERRMGGGRLAGGAPEMAQGAAQA